MERLFYLKPQKWQNAEITALHRGTARLVYSCSYVRLPGVLPADAMLLHLPGDSRITGISASARPVVILESYLLFGKQLGKLQNTKLCNLQVCMCLCVFTTTCMHTQIYNYIHIANIHIQICIKMHKHINMYIHICTYIYICKQGSLSSSFWLVCDSLWNFLWGCFFASHWLFSEVKVFVGQTQSPCRLICVFSLTQMGFGWDV